MKIKTNFEFLFLYVCLLIVGSVADDSYNLYRPNNPYYPNIPNNSYRPNYPFRPNYPPVPNNPNNSFRPNYPSVPNYPNNSFRPNYPSVPNYPNNSFRPNYPSVPNYPNNSYKPNNPNNSYKPNNPNNSFKPNNPPVPNSPNNPSIPNNPNTSLKPNNPSVPNYPNNANNVPKPIPPPIDYCKLKCPLSDFTRLIHLPGPTKSHFYKCELGVGILFECPPNTHFNPRDQVCDWPKRAKAVACKGSPNANQEGSGDSP